MGLTIILLFFNWRVVQHNRFMLTSILKFRRFFMLVEVTLRIDNGMSLLKMVRTFPTNPKGVMRECFYTSIRGTRLPLCDKFKHTSLRHP